MISHPIAEGMTLTREQTEIAKARAWSRYAAIPHPDIKIGWAEYLAELDAINSLRGQHQVVARPSKRERKRLIEEVLTRDGPGCWLCEVGTSPFDRTLEHLDPISRGGTNDPDNLVLAHTGCNRAMGNLLLPEKIALRAEMRAAISKATLPTDKGGV